MLFMGQVAVYRIYFCRSFYYLEKQKDYLNIILQLIIFISIVSDKGIIDVLLM